MFGNMKEMMQQAQQMQFKLAEVQEKFKEIFVEGEAGGGMVKVVMSCAHVVKSVDIDPSLLADDADKETLEDLIAAAMNNAMAAKDDKVKEETEAMMKSMGLPPEMMGGGGLPF